MDTYVKTYNLPSVNHEEAENLTGSTTQKKTESVMKKQLPPKQTEIAFTGEFYQKFKG